MSRGQTIVAGWAMTIAAFGTAVTAFPAIADKAADQREKMQWQIRAEAFQSTEIALGPEDSVYSFAEGDISYIASLTRLHTDTATQDVDMRDLSLTEDLIDVTDSDIKTAKSNAAQSLCLAEAVYYEARSETRAGQKAVAEVVLNRVASKHFPNTICGVVYQGAERVTGCQFSFTCDGSMSKAPRGKAWERSQDVAAMALTSGYKPMTARSTHYHTVDVDPHWSSSLKMTKNIGSHRFYRFKPRRRTVPTVSVMTAPPS